MELMITVALVALLSAGAASLLGNGPQKTTRDNHRSTDVSSIQQALETYRNDKGGYPTNANYACSSAPPSNCLATAYIKAIPVDPKNVAPYVYTYNGTGTCATYCTSYTITWASEKNSGAITTVTNP